MRLRKSLLFALLSLLFSYAAGTARQAKDAPRSFSLSTNRTFAPGESVKIQLFARNVPALEFRVYKVRDAEKFFAGLKDVHSFGVRRALHHRSRSMKKPGSSGCTTLKLTYGGAYGASFAGSLPMRRGIAFEKARASWASAARWWERRSLRRFPC